MATMITELFLLFHCLVLVSFYFFICSVFGFYTFCIFFG